MSLELCKQGPAAGIQLSALNLLLLTHPQFIQEFRLALWLGRTLALPSEELVNCKRHIEYKDTDGRVQQLQASQQASQLFSISQQPNVAQAISFSMILCRLTWLSPPLPEPSLA
jgi:hypothetical protein